MSVTTWQRRLHGYYAIRDERGEPTLQLNTIPGFMIEVFDVKSLH